MIKWLLNKIMSEIIKPKKSTNKSKYRKIEDIFRLNHNDITLKREISRNLNSFNPDDVAKFILEKVNIVEELKNKIDIRQKEISRLNEIISDYEDKD